MKLYLEMELIPSELSNTLILSYSKVDTPIHTYIIHI